MCKKFEPSSRIPKPGTKEREELDKRFEEAIARYEALPETIALREAVKRSGDVDLRIRMNV